jgi:Amt family ammonium transporter
VVHINAGMAALMGALVLGKRIGYPKSAMAPHSLTMTMIGACLLWVGWFGFNAGSNLEATGTAVLAMVNTVLATAAAALAWMFMEWMLKGKPSLLGAVSGAVAGLVAVTPASGFGGPMGTLMLGLVAGVTSFFFCTAIKNALGYDDTLDVFGVHAIAGIIGALGTGIVVDPALGGAGIVDYTQCAVENGAFTGLCGALEYNMVSQVITQAMAVLLTIIWSGVGSLVVYLIIAAVVGLRVSEETEREGLDIASHGEKAYNL